MYGSFLVFFVILFICWQINTYLLTSPPSDLENAIEMIQKAMFYFGNALYHGGVYGRPKEAKYTHVYMMQVDSYLHKLLASELLQDPIMKHQREIEKYPSSHDCTIIPQIEFHFNLIEVMENV